MTVFPLSAPDWVAQPQSLRNMIQDLARRSRIAVDTESNSLHAFREQVCLIQFSTPEIDYLVDPLALDDLSSLGPIFAEPSIEKVFHAAEYDLICLKRDFGFTAANLFDTMQAARILGYHQVGLDSILSEKMGLQLDKKYQKADWGKRPLPADMLSYARLDTRHLLALRDCLQAELQSCGRWDLAREEFNRLAKANGNGKPEVPAWQRIGGSQKFSDRQNAVLKAVCAWRESKARRLNRPVFKVMDDRQLAALAVLLPQSEKDLVMAGLTQRQVAFYGSEILRAVREGQAAAPISRPRTVRPKQSLLHRLELLTEWRKQAALKLKVESDIILPKPWLHAIAERNPQNLAEIEECMPDSPWRLKNFGPEILIALASKHPQAKEG
jgi:ribonuclease D